MSFECCEGRRPLRFSRRYFVKQRHRHGRAQHHARVSSTRHRRNSFLGKKEAGRFVSTRRRRRFEHCVPFGEQNYYRMRPTIAIPEPRLGSADCAFDLDGFFGLHPSLASLAALFHKNELAIVHAAGSPILRARISMRRILWSRHSGRTATEDGWLNRALENVPEENASPFRAVAMAQIYRACCAAQRRPSLSPTCANSR